MSVVEPQAQGRERSRTTARHLLVLLLAAAGLFFAGLGSLPLVEPDEGRNAEVGREMQVSGDWITPQFNGGIYLDKPAVFFWLEAASMRAWGVSEWAARFPSALAAFGTLILAWSLARRMGGERAALRAAMVFATSPLALALGRLATFDMTLAFLVTLALASFWRIEAGEADRAWPHVVLFGACGLATITKGPVGFLLPLLSILAYQALRGRMGELKRLRWGLGLMVFLALAAPWFVAVSLRHPDFPRYAFWQESLRRFASGEARRTGALLYYLPVYLAGFFPWSFFLLFAGWNRLKRWRELRDESQKHLLFLLASAGVVFLFFTVSQSKLPGYFLPALVPMSILMGVAWTEAESVAGARAPDWLRRGFAALLGVGLLLAGASRWGLSWAMGEHWAKNIHPSVLAALKPSLLYSGLILVALSVLGRNFAARGARGAGLAWASFALAALTAPILAVRWIAPLRAYTATVSSRGLAARIQASAEKSLPLYGYYYFRTSLPFYLRRPVGLITYDGGETTSNYVSLRVLELRRGAKESGGASNAVSLDSVNPNLIDLRDLAGRSARGPILILARNTHVGDLAQMAAEMEPLWVNWDYSVWKIPKGSIK